MLNAATLLGMALLAQQFGGAFAPPAPPGSGVPSVPPPLPAPLTPAASPPAPQQGVLPRGLTPLPECGDAGTSDLTGAVALATNGGWGASLGYHRFLVDGLAPGLAAAYYSFGTLDEIWLVASLRVVPLRTSRFGLALTPQAARVFVWGYADGWAYGGSATAIFGFAAHFGLEAGIEVFLFEPSAFARSVSDTSIYRPTVGIVVFL